MPDYWSALLASDGAVHSLEDPSSPLDFETELQFLVEERLSAAVSLCTTYELAGPPSTGKL